MTPARNRGEVLTLLHDSCCIFTVKQFIKMRREQNLQTHLAFVDCEKAFSRVDIFKLRQILEKRQFKTFDTGSAKPLPKYKNYAGLKYGTIKEIINQGVRHGCSFSPDHFSSYLGEISGCRGSEHEDDCLLGCCAV
jgi:hypothetical protein